MQTRRVAALFATLSILSGSCGSLVKQGRSPSYVIINSLTAASGAKPQEFGNVLASDVVTFVKITIGGQEVFVPTIFADNGQVIVKLGLKDIGPSTTPASPTTNNQITLTRYRVVYTRSDGRNREGVDVPYAFDGAITHTVLSEPSSFGFTLVRIQAKEEPPLRALRGLGGALTISTIAEVTFYGHDQTGTEVTVTGAISVNFADWGDPQ
ncbi:MAG: hypothetical protein HYZ58_19875 [Acidobacteria bacterium]|nr:hypothetical protein [Acidobacteriota bacterium]